MPTDGAVDAIRACGSGNAAGWHGGFQADGYGLGGYYIANLPVPDLPERPFGTEITLYKETGTQCWRMTDSGWKLAWWDPMNGADNWI